MNLHDYGKWTHIVEFNWRIKDSEGWVLYPEIVKSYHMMGWGELPSSNNNIGFARYKYGEQITASADYIILV